MEPTISFTVEDDLVRGVIAAAVMAEKQRLGLWQDVLRALCWAAAESKQKSVNDFLFQAMVDRLLEELHSGGEKDNAVRFYADSVLVYR